MNIVKVVLNNNYGVFNLSQEAFKELIKKGWTVTEFNDEHKPKDKDADIIFKQKGNPFGYADEGYHLNWFKLSPHSEKFRSNLDVVEVVEKLGKKANWNNVEFKIVEVDEDEFWEIENFHDGFERIRK